MPPRAPDRPMPDFAHEMTWLIYACLLLGPFVQEDAALLAAAGYAASGAANPLIVFAVFLLGLSISDVWKYAIGLAAHRFAWARRFAERGAVKAAERVLTERPARTLLTVRFIPGARMATYIAAGYVRAPFPPFAFWVVVSAAILTALTFASFLVLGAALGERLRAWLPLAALVLAALGLTIWAARSRLRKTRPAAPSDAG
ncbi:MAG: VTT domain-containing protein [Caulobacterales bacterium]|nr:VTT domain-containing protein [Caulobacterales bacterium]